MFLYDHLIYVYSLQEYINETGNKETLNESRKM